MELDPNARLELEALADHWRDVYPAGLETYGLRLFEELVALQTTDQINSHEAGLLSILILKYVNREAAAIDWEIRAFTCPRCNMTTYYTNDTPGSCRTCRDSKTSLFEVRPLGRTGDNSPKR